MSHDASIVISAREVAKTYRIWHHPSARARALLYRALGLHRAAAAGYRDFHAVQPLSFEIRRGEAIGIIGRNGSGKSTLLQLIAGILQPTSGSLAASGRISALLELGSGFNPEFTGRENVYLNGSILGLSAKDMDARIDGIITFADIGEFIDEPVKTYSSGMMMRLAFAVAVSVQPDILIIDEALSVGDVFFTQKCFARIREILAAGTTLIFVSHDTAAVQNLCTRGLLAAPRQAAARWHTRGMCHPLLLTRAPPGGRSRARRSRRSASRRSPRPARRSATARPRGLGQVAPRGQAPGGRGRVLPQPSRPLRP